MGSEERWSKVSFNSFILRYIRHYTPINLNIYLKNVLPNFMWVYKFGQVWELPQRFKITLQGWIFSKIVPNITILEGIFETYLQRLVFLIRVIFKGFHVEHDFNCLINLFLSRFILKEISNLKLKPISNFSGNCSE